MGEQKKSNNNAHLEQDQKSLSQDNHQHDHKHDLHDHKQTFDPNQGLSEISQNPASKPVERTFNESNPYYHIINQAVDPETGVGLADMGLIYQVNDHDGVIEVIMTLTSMGCPAGPMLTTDVDGVLRLQPNVKDVEIQVVWDPPWTPDMMNQEVRAMLFGGF